MTPEKWENTLGHIKDTFRVLDSGKEHIEEEGGIDIEYIEFEGPLGKMRLEHITKPVILDRKTSFSKRIGSETAIEYIYSPDEKTNLLNVYKWDEEQDDWVEVEAKNFNFG